MTRRISQLQLPTYASAQAVSTVTECAYSRRLRCMHCGTVSEVLEADRTSPGPCCDEHISAPAIEQDLASR